MRRRGPIVAGVLLGIAAGLFLASRVASLGAERETGPMLPEHGGAIRSVVMQYAAGSEFVFPVYREFLRQQAAGLTVYLACPERADFDEVRGGIGEVSCKVVPVFTHHAMTPWSRDRWVAMLPVEPGGKMTLMAAPWELQQQTWAERAGDSRVIDDLAAALGLKAKRSAVLFDGGDLLADEGGVVFATRAVLARNEGKLGREKIVAALEREVHRRVVLMDEGPDHHAGMFMMSAGGKRMVVGDPSLGKVVFDVDAETAAALDGGAAFDEATQRRFDFVAEMAKREGYAVTRIPVAPASVGKVYMTYVNVILDRREGRKIVYMPTFAGQERMNDAAAEVWRGLGFEVKRVDCTTVFGRGGTLHCLVNVLEREPPGGR